MIAKVARDGLSCGGRGEAKSAMIAKVARDGVACGGRGEARCAVGGPEAFSKAWLGRRQSSVPGRAASAVKPVAKNEKRAAGTVYP